MSSWVVDASPLIFLAKLDRLDYLSRSADSIVTPPAVLAEIQGQRDSAASRILEAEKTWLEVEEPRETNPVRILKAEMGLGESEAIVLALEIEAERIVMDDLDARRVGLHPIGTLGLLLAARLRGELPSLREEIQKLEQLGFRASGSLVTAVLESAGELG